MDEKKLPRGLSCKCPHPPSKISPPKVKHDPSPPSCCPPLPAPWEEEGRRWRERDPKPSESLSTKWPERSKEQLFHHGAFLFKRGHRRCSTHGMQAVLWALQARHILPLPHEEEKRNTATQVLAEAFLARHARRERQYGRMHWDALLRSKYHYHPVKND